MSETLMWPPKNPIKKIEETLDCKSIVEKVVVVVISTWKDIKTNSQECVESKWVDSKE